jgi:hypothetical protein
LTNLRPLCIVSSRDSITAPISHYITRILTPITIKTQYQVRDSIHLKNELLNHTIPDTHILTSFDITNLYPSIPQATAIAAVRRLLEQNPTLQKLTPLSVDQIITLLEAFLCLTHFQWLGEFYALIDGCAIGTAPAAPCPMSSWGNSRRKSSLNTEP